MEPDSSRSPSSCLPRITPRLLFTLTTLLITCTLAAPALGPGASHVSAAELPAPAAGIGATTDASLAYAGSMFMAQSGHNLSNGFLSYWLGHGQADLLGNPLSEELQEGKLTVQYFEKTRLEYNPQLGSNGIGPSNVGSLLTAGRKFPTIKAFKSTKDRIYVAATQHSLGGVFYTYYQHNGGVASFGNPISEQLQENGHTVQYFERTRLELVGGKVRVGNVGTELLAQKGGGGKLASVQKRPQFAMSYSGKATNFPGNWSRIISLNQSWGNLPYGYKGYGLYAAMPADLHLYGRWAKVTKNSKSIWVQLIDVVDWKDISLFRAQGKVIDLGTESFQQFAPLKAGVISVHVDVAWPGEGPDK